MPETGILARWASMGSVALGYDSSNEVRAQQPTRVLVTGGGSRPQSWTKQFPDTSASCDTFSFSFLEGATTADHSHPGVGTMSVLRLFVVKHRTRTSARAPTSASWRGA